MRNFEIETNREFAKEEEENEEEDLEEEKTLKFVAGFSYK